MTGRNPRSNLYTLGKIVHDKTIKRNVYVHAPDGYLYSGGIRLVKMNELPEWYVNVYVWKCHGYMNAKGVKDLIYVPNFFTNHVYKDDLLYVSYKNPIVPDAEYYKTRNTAVPAVTDNKVRSDLWYAGYDYLVSGPCIVDFAEAVQKYQPDFPQIENILFAMRNKPFLIKIRAKREELGLRDKPRRGR